MRKIGSVAAEKTGEMIAKGGDVGCPGREGILVRPTEAGREGKHKKV